MTMIGKTVFWTDSPPVKGNNFFRRERCGVVHAEDDGGSVSVTMGGPGDTQCPDDERGLRLAIPAGSWRRRAVANESDDAS